MKLAEITFAEGIATLRLDTPWGMNSLGLDGFGVLRGHLAELADDPRAEAVILTGTGRAFCAGAALDTLRDAYGATVDAATLRDRFDTAVNPLTRTMLAMPKPLVTAINGTVAGGGMGLALAADIVIASRQARFHCGFVPMLGIVPDAGTSWFLPNLIGRSRALAMALLNESIDADEAERLGLVRRAVDPAQLESTARDHATRLMQLPPEALRMTRTLFTAALSSDPDTILDRERDANVVLCQRPELAEGVAAFLARRPPDFRALRRTGDDDA